MTSAMKDCTVVPVAPDIGEDVIVPDMTVAPFLGTGMPLHIGRQTHGGAS
jgi:hypothetical protein